MANQTRLVTARYLAAPFQTPASQRRDSLHKQLALRLSFGFKGVYDMDVHKMVGLVLSMCVIGCANTGTPNPSDGSGRMPKIVAEGTCWVGLWVEMSGAVSQAQLIKSTGVPRIDAACLNAVRGQKFEADLIIDPLLTKPGELRRYKVVELHWQQKSPAR